MITEKIAKFVAETRDDQIPGEALKIAERCVIDTLGVALAGSRQPEGPMIIEACKEEEGCPSSGVITGGFKSSPCLAALANGTLAHALDYDDIWLGAHPSAVLVPAVLALAESRGISGRKALVSYVVGFEVGAKVGTAMGLKLFEGNWHVTPIQGTIAATAAAARILELSVEQTTMAFGIASSLAGGLKRNHGTMTKPLHAGNAARNGILAGLLAMKGFTGDSDVFEGEYNLFQTFVGEEGDLRSIEENIGKTWDLVSPSVWVKAYSCCGASHSGIDAMLYLRNRYKISPHEVAEIECKTSPTMIVTAIKDFPKTAQESRFSIRYALTVALTDGAASMKQFTEEKLKDPLTQEIMSKVKYSLYPPHEGPGMDMTEKVTIRLKDGKEYSDEVKESKGHLSNPLSDDELSFKFKDCASLVLGPREIDLALELAWDLEKLNNLGRLIETVSCIPS
jgi:2-methylcitrate dehydratase PrpD